MPAPVSGANMRLAMAREATYGTAPATGWSLVPAVSLALAETQRFADNDLIGQGNQPLRPAREQSDFGGGATVPADLRAVGFWLTMAFGNPTTTAEAPLYRHRWRSGSDDLPSYSLERVHPETTPDLVVLYRGVRANSVTVSFDPVGSATLDLELLYQGHDRSTTALSGSATALAVDRFTQFDNYILREGDPLARITNASIPYGLNLEQVRYLGGGGAIGDIVPGIRSSSGRLTARFLDWSLFELARTEAVFALELGFAKPGAGAPELRFIFDQVEFGNPSDPVQGGGGIAATFPLMASKDPTSGFMLTVELLNDVASYAP
jgi:Phage tail tube protein